MSHHLSAVCTASRCHTTNNKTCLYVMVGLLLQHLFESNSLLITHNPSCNCMQCHAVSFSMKRHALDIDSACNCLPDHEAAPACHNLGRNMAKYERIWSVLIRCFIRLRTNFFFNRIYFVKL